jgi:hypothetical protein
MSGAAYTLGCLRKTRCVRRTSGSVATALAALDNATVTFTVTTAGTTVDADTGNVVPNTTTVAVSAYLKGESVNEVVYPGVNQVTTLFEGYVTSAGGLDARVIAGTSGSLVFAGQAAVDCEVLEARLPYGTSGLLGSTLVSALGPKIRLVSRKQT